MIARLKGCVDEITKDRFILDVNSVGYAVRISELDRKRMPGLGERVTLEIYTHVREDAFELFGFMQQLDRDVFEFLMEANGVGPKLALAALSHASGEQLLASLSRGEVTALAGVPGIGKKKAERLVLELREKCEKRFADILYREAKSAPRSASENISVSARWLEDLEAALLGLGYRDIDVRRALAYVVVMQKNLRPNLEAYLKECLKFLSSGNTKSLVGNA